MGLIHHIGNLSGGHYVTAIKDARSPVAWDVTQHLFSSGDWSLKDDSRTKLVSTELLKDRADQKKVF